MSNEGARFQSRRAIRFIFEYEGERLRLVTRQTVDMVVPVAAPPGADAPGYYLDARDAQERTLARVAAHGAFSRGAEVFPERHDDPIARVDVERQRGAFTVTLPEVDEADHVTVVRVTAGRPAGAGVERVQAQAVDIASFPLSAR